MQATESVQPIQTFSLNILLDLVVQEGKHGVN